MFVFCAGDCPFESESSPTCADAYGEVTNCNANFQEVSKCSTRGGSWGMCITFASEKQANKAEPTLSLKSRAEEMSPEIQNRGTNDHKIGHMCPPKTLKKHFPNYIVKQFNKVITWWKVLKVLIWSWPEWRIEAQTADSGGGFILLRPGTDYSTLVSTVIHFEPDRQCSALWSTGFHFTETGRPGAEDLNPLALVSISNYCATNLLKKHVAYSAILKVSAHELKLELIGDRQVTN